MTWYAPTKLLNTRLTCDLSKMSLNCVAVSATGAGVKGELGAVVGVEGMEEGVETPLSVLLLFLGSVFEELSLDSSSLRPCNAF